MGQDRYTIPEALQVLGISKSALDSWIKRAGLRESISSQRMEDDMREHFITREQLESLATSHRRQIATTANNLDPLARLEAVDSALTERIEKLEERLEAVEHAISAKKPE